MDQMQILRNLDLGNMIAELDDILNSSFVLSSTYYDFIHDRSDIIRGAKGTGKTALLLYIFSNHSTIHELDNTILIKANEHRGDPHFKKTFEDIDASCGIDVYADAWKVYFINLLWKELECIDSKDSKLKDLKNYLEETKVITKKDGFLQKLIHSVLRAKYSVTHEGIECGFQLGDIEKQNIVIDFNYIFTVASDILDASNKRVWILLDRLDDAFPDWSDSSQNALKSLFYVYKDLLGVNGIKLKTFIRSDIFDRISKEGFVSLSHIYARASSPISWEDSRIEEFICNRFKTTFPHNSDTQIIEIVLGQQIDIGKKQPQSMRWVINHLKDGLGTCTPRDILGLLSNARLYTMTELETGNMKQQQPPLFSKASIKDAWSKTSTDKLHTQIYAENPELKDKIELLRDGKSEYSNLKLEKLFGKEYRLICTELQYVGILSKYGDGMKIPFLFRPCLSIKQGKA